ncbi:hypothetical protein ABIF66_001599 [Bradyrhizobium japonicum]
MKVVCSNEHTVTDSMLETDQRGAHKRSQCLEVFKQSLFVLVA